MYRWKYIKKCYQNVLAFTFTDPVEDRLPTGLDDAFISREAVELA